MLEFILVMLNKFSNVGIVGCGVIGIFIFCTMLAKSLENSFDDWLNFIKPFQVKFSCAFVICLLIAILPSIDDLYRVRIFLIKFQLASPENVTKATETIERIGKKLECKYLGCETKEKKDETTSTEP